MTKEEAIAKIKELEEYIKELDNKVGFEDDEIFILSIEEYNKYKDIITLNNYWWWLRSSGNNKVDTAYVMYDGTIYYNGISVLSDNVCVRPVLRVSNLESIEIGKRFIKYDFPWIKIDDNLAIAEVPIGWCKFDKKSNDYATSEIRQYLKNWLEGRKNGRI